MLIMLDSMAERYGILPSECLQRANTLDLTVLTAAVSYRNELNEAAANNAVPGHKQPTQEEMIAMLERARNRKAQQ
jgi:hypothetical protein